MEVANHLPRLLPIKDVAATCALSPSRIYELIRLGKLRSVHFGRQVRVAESDLLDFIATGGYRLERGQVR